jgi:hypothetical protein
MHRGGGGWMDARASCVSPLGTYATAFLSLRMCTSLNFHKAKKGVAKVPSKQPVTCVQCGLSVVDKHVLKRHVSNHRYLVF